eukprot:TRINITY_DN3806_c0_g1_i1.p1 TRINITY_DN3806_c0_g1~~TRINITY_DN3806_c0_g1_i1.p1  ORF type:complete len:448 (+),score=125.40 TRINITY_DN3806_c0_g1_i1:49-1392(+)
MWNLLMGNTESSESSEEAEDFSVFSPPGDPEGAPLERKEGDGEEEGNKSHPQLHHDPHPHPYSSLPPPEILLLDRLPPLESSLSQSQGTIPITHLRPSIPSSPLVPEVPLLSSSGRSKVSQGSKEPKFVPYEPYKAAITPLETCPAYLLAHRKEPKSKERRRLKENAESVTENANTTASKASAAMQEEIRELGDKLQEAERSLKIQIQVNSEVKKLLVASVGEDLEARVDFLTQDKARLAADLRQYANKISRDFEEKETLSVESNLWKSKFLATSLLVDDLARWKASLVQVNQDYEHTARVILHEHSVIWNTLLESLSNLSELNDAFDPLEETFKPAEAASLLGASDYVLSLSNCLKKRLMKDLKPQEDPFKLCKIKTPGEEHVDALLCNHLLSSSLSDTDVYNKMACNAVKGAARVHLQTLKDKTSSADFKEFKSCTHCQGSVQNI